MGDIVFPPEIRQWIASRLGEGYADESDYLIDLVRRDMVDAAQPETPEEIAWIREQIEIGEQSGICDKNAFEVLREIREGRNSRRG